MSDFTKRYSAKRKFLCSVEKNRKKLSINELANLIFFLNYIIPKIMMFFSTNKRKESKKMRSICPYCKAVYDDLPKEYLHKVVECSSCGKEFVCKDADKVKKTEKKSDINLGKKVFPIVKWGVLIIVLVIILKCIIYNLPSSRKAREEKQAKLHRIQFTYMTNDGETPYFREEVARLNDKYVYEEVPKHMTTRQKCADSVREILNRWNNAVSGFKKAEQKQFTNKEIEVLAQLCGFEYWNAHLILTEFDLPNRIALIQKSQAQAAQVGKQIYEVAKKTAPGKVFRKEKKLIEEYENLINEGNLTPEFKQKIIRNIFEKSIKLHYGEKATVEGTLLTLRTQQITDQIKKVEKELAEKEKRYLEALADKKTLEQYYYGDNYYFSFYELMSAANFEYSAGNSNYYDKLCKFVSQAKENLEGQSKAVRELVSCIERFNAKGSVDGMKPSDFIKSQITPLQNKLRELQDRENDIANNKNNDITLNDIGFLY